MEDGPPLVSHLKITGILGTQGGLMLVIFLGHDVYRGLATGVLLLHAIFILWVVFGAFFTRSRPVLRWLHIASLGWGILTEVSPWPCPLTTLEDWLESQAGVQPYQGGFLLHYLDALVYPNISGRVLTIAGVAVCVFNLAVYARRFWKARIR
jgi:Protein of Unknown function (DUF2784)